MEHVLELINTLTDEKPTVRSLSTTHIDGKNSMAALNSNRNYNSLYCGYLRNKTKIDGVATDFGNMKYCEVTSSSIQEKVERLKNEKLSFGTAFWFNCTRTKYNYST